MLSRDALIELDALLDAVAITMICSKENKAVINEKEVCDGWASSGYVNSLYVLEGSLMINDRRNPENKEQRDKGKGDRPV